MALRAAFVLVAAAKRTLGALSWHSTPLTHPSCRLVGGCLAAHCCHPPLQTAQGHVLELVRSSVAARSFETHEYQVMAGGCVMAERVAALQLHLECMQRMLRQHEQLDLMEGQQGELEDGALMLLDAATPADDLVADALQHHHTDSLVTELTDVMHGHLSGEASIGPATMPSSSRLLVGSGNPGDPMVLE